VSDDKDYTKQPQPWSETFAGSGPGWTDDFGVFHAGNQPDMGDSGPHPAGAQIRKQKATEEAAYRKRLEQVARFMEQGRESVRNGGPGSDWPGWQERLDSLHEQALAEQAARATSRYAPPKPSETAPAAPTGMSAPLPPSEPISDAVGRSLLARWRRHR
jgi:hypothetical protein